MRINEDYLETDELSSDITDDFNYRREVIEEIQRWVQNGEELSFDPQVLPDAFIKPSYIKEMISGNYNDELVALCHMTIKLCGSDCNLNWIDTSEIINMNSLTMGISNFFNGDVTRWDVSNVRDMSFMFCGCVHFNRDISKWKTGKVRNMQYMFSVAESFNCDISGWDVHNVTNMQAMFRDSAIDCDLSKWNVDKVKNHRDMFVRTKMEFDYDRQPKFKT